MIGYVYLTTNSINNKKYVGKHVSSKFDPFYKGSGKLILRALKKYGTQNFIDKGYTLGRTLSQIWVNNLEQEKYILFSELQNYLDNNWVRGRLKKNK